MACISSYILCVVSIMIFGLWLPLGLYIAVYIGISVQLLSRVRLCSPMDCSTLGFSIHHLLPEVAQTHVHRVGDAIHPSHPLSSPSPPAPNPSQHQIVSRIHFLAAVELKSPLACWLSLGTALSS